MKNPVIIKSYKNGLSVYLNEEMGFEELLAALGEKFRESERFFGDMKVAVSFEGRVLTQEQENRMVDAISQNSRLHVICVVGKDDGKEDRFSQTVAAFERFFPRGEASGKFYHDFKYKSKEKSRWFKAKKGQPQIALCKDGKIQMQALTNELLNELPY